MEQNSPAQVHNRLPLLAGLIILFAVALFFRLWYLQVIKGAYYQEQAESNRIRPVKIRPPRGIFYDRKGRLTETAQRRLQPISEATELGAGSQIALRVVTRDEEPVDEGFLEDRLASALALRRAAASGRGGKCVGGLAGRGGICYGAG